MAKAILETRAREMVVPVNQVRVIVPCHGVNVIEALLWLELGAHVVTVEVNSFALRKFKERMPSPDKFFGRWEAVGPGRQRVEPGDIVAVSHPSGSLNLLPDCLEPQDLLGFGKDDALFVIQSDAAPVFVRPFLEDPEFLARYDTLLHDVEIGVGNYFFSSCHVWFRRFRSELCIVKRDGIPTGGELQKVQGPPGLLGVLARSWFGSRKRPV